MCRSLKNGCETSQCLVIDSWNNDESDSVDEEAAVATTSFIYRMLMGLSMTPENVMTI
jgi:hypothetical protein